MIEQKNEGLSLANSKTAENLVYFIQGVQDSGKVFIPNWYTKSHLEENHKIDAERADLFYDWLCKDGKFTVCQKTDKAMKKLYKIFESTL